MWALKILSGPLAGRTYNLKSGKNRFGRAPQTDFQLQGDGVSKEHFEINVLPDKMLITDLRSSNGTFLNGTRIQNAILRVGDKLAAHQLMMEVVFAVEQSVVAHTRVRQQTQHSVRALTPGQPPMNPGSQFPAAGFPPQQQNYQMDPAMMFPGQAPGGMSAPPPEYAPADFQPKGLMQKIEDFVENVVMPVFYQMPKTFDFRMVVFGFGVVFVFLLTLVSLFPMKQITAETVLTESTRRAMTVARALAATNERVIRSQSFDKYSSDLQVKEEGIEDVYILSKDGRILAPAERMGTSPAEAGFTRSVVSENRSISIKIGVNKIGAAVPIMSFDPEIQQPVARAYAVVIYNPAGLSFDDQRALSLFVQMLVISLALGLIVFYILNRLIEHPFRLLTEGIDKAIRDGNDHVELDLQMPVVGELLVNVNSLLSRVGSKQEVGGDSVSPMQRQKEIENMVQLMGYPCLLINRDQIITYISPVFEDLTGVSAGQLINQALQFLPDQAMQKNISELMDLARNQNQVIHQDRLPIAGDPFQISCQSLSVSADSDLFLVVFSPLSAAEGGAA